jgi:hypothetical protein
MKNPLLEKLFWGEVPLPAKKERYYGNPYSKRLILSSCVTLSQKIVFIKGLFQQAPSKAL